MTPISNDEYQRAYNEGKTRGRLEVLVASALAAGFILLAWHLPKLIIYFNRDW